MLSALPLILVSLILLSLAGCEPVAPEATATPEPAVRATASPAAPTAAPVGSPMPTPPAVAASASPTAPGPRPTSPPVRPPAAVPARTGGVLRLAGENPLTLDPALSQDVSSWSYLLQIYSGLVGLDDRLEVVPDVASSWSVSDDGRTYTFLLRPDARFHDGRPVTADDFKYSVERALDPRLRSPVAATYLGDIVGAEDRLSGRSDEVAGIEVVGPRTLRITLDAPKVHFLSKLTYPTAFVVDRANVARGDRWFERPNGTGPFKLQTWQREVRLVLSRNDAYYGGPPALARVEYSLAPGSAMSLYEKGLLDVVGVGPANVERVTDPRGALSRELTRVPQLSLTFVGLNVTQPPFDDPKVRRAFAHATDKRRLADVLYKKMRAKAEGILPPGLPGHDPGFVGLEFDPEKARRLLAESSYGSPGSLPEITLSMGSGGGDLGETIAEMYRRNLGVEVNVEEVQEGYFDGLSARKYQMFYLGWVADYPDPQDFLDVLFHSASEANHGAYSDSEVDQLLERARVEPDRAARLSLYQQVERRVVAAAPVIPLYFDTDYVLVKPRVKGLVWTPMGVLSLRGVWIEG